MNTFFQRLLSPPVLLLAVAILFVQSQQQLFAQQTDTAQNVVNWEFSSIKATDGVSVLVLHGRIREGWRLYSTSMPDSLPNSRVALDNSSNATIAGIDEKGQLQRKKDPLFNAETSFFTGETQWLVTIQPKSGAATSSASAGAPTPATGDLKGTLTFMAIYKDSVVGPIEVPFRYSHVPDG